MFTSTDYDKLFKIMEESSEKKEIISRLLTSHQIMLSTISHEIRNPLTLICSSLELIETSHPEVLTYRYWSDVQHELDYMKSLLNELSTYNNGDRLHISSIDGTTFFKTLALSFASSLIDTNIQFISQIDPDLPAFRGDYIKLREVFLNLLGNAKDALSQTTDPVIRLSVVCQGSFIEITIHDNGCGISKEHLQDIFQPFITYKKNGTGLGLSISQRIIQSHGGSICVKSVLHTYTTFTVTLPLPV